MNKGTKPMRFICGWCNEAVEMTKENNIWNFTDPRFAHPIGYCSEACIKQELSWIEKRMKMIAF